MAARSGSMYNGNPFRLGLFAANCASGLAVTTVPERWDGSWESNVALAQMADKAGIEFMLPLARWKGYGGATGFHASTFETVAWATGLLATTDEITVFGTVHVPLVHPIFAAKQMATADHVGEGRFGLNVVCGWNDPEFEMFAIPQREHDERYAYGQEWLDVVRRIWSTDGSFDFDGEFLQLRGVSGEPKPYAGGEPVLMNAGFSPAGRDFGARNCDFLFTFILNPGTGSGDVAKIAAMAAKYERTVSVVTTSYVVCRSTSAEADEYHRHYVEEHADWDAVERLMELQGALEQPPFIQDILRRRYAGGHGMYPIIGDADTVAQKLGRLAEAGFAGSTIAFVNYLDEFPYFRDEVLPRLEAMGLRRPPAT